MVWLSQRATQMAARTHIPAAAATAAAVTAFYFRKGLRLHDNPALLEACQHASYLYPCFVLDPAIAHPDRVSANRLSFLLESLADLDAQLRSLGSRLFVLRGNPAEVLPPLLQQWGVTHLVAEHDIDPYGRKRDAAIRSRCDQLGVSMHLVHGHTLWDPDAVAAASPGRKVPSAYQSFVKLVGSMPAPPRPYAAPRQGGLPPPPSLPSGVGVGPAAAAAAAAAASSASFSSSVDPFAVPSLSACGYPPAASAVTTSLKGQGGETAGLARLARHLARRGWIKIFAKPDTSPVSLEPSTTLLSPYMSMGCVGARQFYWGLLDAAAATAPGGGAATQPPVSLEGQLLWREFFYAQAATTPNFDVMTGNRACKQIAWGYNPQW